MILIAVAILAGFALLTLALCRAAATGDWQLAQARRQLDDEKLGGELVDLRTVRHQRMSHPDTDPDADLQRILGPHARRAAWRVIPGGRDIEGGAA